MKKTRPAAPFAPGGAARAPATVLTPAGRSSPWVALAAGAALSGCGGIPSLPGFTPYKIEIQQGNYVTQEMVSRLKAGMTRDQVRFALGTPLVADIFHPDRWDYVFVRRAAGAGPMEQRRIAVFFEGDRLVRVEGDVVAQPAHKAEEDLGAGR
ncbi:MAG: outer membrane protein assembly factor BamE [Burkholderiales bacterium]|nr:outer membrane protein assembly factor BamE [Burkholderiales bacterium]